MTDMIDEIVEREYVCIDYINGKAIYMDECGEIYYNHIPFEFCDIGATEERKHLSPIKELTDEEQAVIIHTID